MENEIICPNCNNQYKDECPPRILTMCGHTYCQKCILNMITQQEQSKNKFIIKCPEDDSWMNLINHNLSIFPKNIALLKLIQTKKNNMPFKEQSLNISKIANQDEGMEDDDANQLISAIKEGKSSFSRSYDKQDKASISNSTQQLAIGQSLNITSATQDKVTKPTQAPLQLQMCLLHQKPLEIVCINDAIKICSKCAIFGQHKGHQFKSIQQIQGQSQQYYASLLNIFEQKNNLNDKMVSKQMENDLMMVLNNKTNLIKKQIREAFKKLIQKIQVCEKSCYSELQKIKQTNEQTIKQLLTLNVQSLTKFKKWEQKSYKDITVLQNQNLQQKIRLLYDFDKKKGSNTEQLLAEGSQIIQQFKKQQDNLIPQVQSILVNIKFISNQNFSQSLSSCFKLTNSAEKCQKQKQQGCKQANKQNKIQKQIAKQKILKQNSKINCNFLQKSDVQIKNLSGIKQLDDIHLSDSPLNEQSLLQFQCEDAENKFNAINQMNLNSRPSLLKESIFVQEFCELKLQSKEELQVYQTPLKINNETRRKETNSSKMMTQRPSISFKDTSFFNDKNERPNKKKLKSIKVPQKFEKVLDSIYNESTDLIDFTNAELGDQTVGQICEFIKNGKFKSLKLIRNKLTDQGLAKVIGSFGSIVTLNLSQNNLTQRILDIFLQAKDSLPNLKNLILSQNKIIERKHKQRIQKLRKLNITVSV